MVRLAGSECIKGEIVVVEGVVEFCFTDDDKGDCNKDLFDNGDDEEENVFVGVYTLSPAFETMVSPVLKQISL